jgi:hypothetical protein
VPDWRAILAIGLEAMDETATIAGIGARTSTGWPLAAIKYGVPGIPWSATESSPPYGVWGRGPSRRRRFLVPAEAGSRVEPGMTRVFRTDGNPP